MGKFSLGSKFTSSRENFIRMKATPTQGSFQLLAPLAALLNLQPESDESRVCIQQLMDGDEVAMHNGKPLLGVFQSPTTNGGAKASPLKNKDKNGNVKFTDFFQMSDQDAWDGIEGDTSKRLLFDALTDEDGNPETIVATPEEILQLCGLQATEDVTIYVLGFSGTEEKLKRGISEGGDNEDFEEVDED